MIIGNRVMDLKIKTIQGNIRELSQHVLLIQSSGGSKRVGTSNSSEDFAKIS
jgi:hypothetical protein